MENESSTKLKDNQSNEYYLNHIKQMTENAQLELENMKNRYQKLLHIQSNETKLRNLAKQKTREVILMTTKQEKDDADNDDDADADDSDDCELILQALEKTVNKESKLQLKHRTLLKSLEEKTESGELPDYIQISFIALQAQSDQRQCWDQYNVVNKTNKDLLIENHSKVDTSSSSSDASPFIKIESSEEEYVFGEFREINPKQTFNSEPTSPHREKILKSGFSSRSMKNHNLTKSENLKNDKAENLFGNVMKTNQQSSKNSDKKWKIMNLPKRTKFVMLNKASAISQYLERLKDITELSNKVSCAEKKLKKLDNFVENGKKRQNQNERRKKDRIEKKLKELSIDLNQINMDLVDYSDIETMTDPNISDIEEMKREIRGNAGEASQQFVAIQQLQDLQNYCAQLEVENKVLFLSNDRKLSEFKTIIANLRAVDPLFYSDDRKRSSLVDPRLTQMKNRKEGKLEAIENKIHEIQSNTDEILFRIKDLNFLIDILKKQRMKMMQAPKADVKGLCFNLTNNRIVFNEQKRQISFAEQIKNFIDSNSMKLKERYSRQSLERLENDNNWMEMKVNELKTRFDHLRAARENHSFVLTNEEEMKFLQRKVHDIISAIDVSKMRMNGLLSKVDKQMRLVNQQQILLPEPPSSVKRNQEITQKKKNKLKSFS